jgi:hypothetical protein
MLKPGNIVIGLDLGQKRDPSALAILEVGEDVTGRRDPVTWEWKPEPYVNLLYLSALPWARHTRTPSSRCTAHANLCLDFRWRNCVIESKRSFSRTVSRAWEGMACEPS